ncbi:uroporphyrinogen-III synthase [Terrimonas alba]|uniref:uroporphyrinogen-III synthase n=1 Tax=Terrimonas alba TaxID=3349636 RepID=UPI0035F48C67
MPSIKPSILCTGPVDQSATQMAESNDVDIDVIPFTEIKSYPPQTIQPQIQSILQQKAVVVFTSGNAIKPVVQLLDGFIPAWTIYCIGYSTYELAKQYFGEENIKGTAGNAATLAAKIIAGRNTNEVIFFCGNLRRNDLPAALVQQNIAVKEITVYHTTLVPKPIEKDYDAILFFSPSAAESFFIANDLPPKTVLFVMGHTTAVEIKKFSANKIIRSDEPIKNKLVMKAVEFVKNNSSAVKQDS